MAVDVEEAYRRYGPMVLRRCRRLLGDEESAMDAMQDVFVQLLRHEQDLDAQAPSSLLYRIATNVCLNRLRTRRRRPEHPDDDLLAALAHHHDADGHTQARSILGRLFRHQPESSATIAVMHWLDGMTLERVAEEVGMSVSGVRKRLRGLRAQLDEQTGREP